LRLRDSHREAASEMGDRAQRSIVSFRKKQMRLTVAYEFLPKTPTTNAAVVMDHFGVGFETGRHVIADGLELPIQPGDIICFTGTSGSGKSSLMRAAVAQLDNFVWCDRLDLGEQILVDGLALPAQEALALLASCGLGEAQLLLRTPRELSDGQRYRYRLAKAIALQPQWIVADEFTAALDRTLAKVIAFNLRKLATRTGIGCLLATTHEDVLDDLQPDVHVACRLDGAVSVETHGLQPVGFAIKKKTSASRASCGSPAAPVPTGRTSLGGITAATTWASSATSRCCGTGTNRSASASSPRRRSRSGSAPDSSASPADGRG
jgi:ABC-type lipoprotein export system ATPase subunit